jgi:ribosomal protein S15P/S13E
MAVSKNTLKKPVWLKYVDEEVKEIILKIVEKDPNITAEKIGLILRDNYGIPQTRIYNLKISEILKKANKYKSPDLENLEKKVKKLESHLSKNKQDKRTGRALIITKAKLKKVKDYLQGHSAK